MNRALIITGKLVQDHEFIYPFYRLKEEGYEVDVAVDNGMETHGQIGIKIIPNKNFDNINVEDYQILVLPGGAKCLEYLRQDMRVIKFIKDFAATGKVIASICHAAQLLISAKLVKGKKIAAYYSLKDDVENAGAEFVDLPAVIDGNIVSTAHYKDMGPWMKAAINMTSMESKI
jgi:protease I